MTGLFTVENLVALLTLTSLEVVLGIDNIVFLSILVSKLPAKLQSRARKLGLGLAMGARIGLLLCISWVMKLTNDLFTVLGHGISGKDMILIIGGLFLVGKSAHEIFDKLEGGGTHGDAGTKAAFASIIIQIVIMDAVFSLDSVITAVGMAQSIPVMITAVVIAVLIMMKFAGNIGSFVERHPSVKILALAFLILIGVMLVAEGIGQHVNKATIYVAMAFALGVEVLNMRYRKKSKPVIGGISGDDEKNHADEYRRM